jgi:hypothetical protein
MFQVSFYAFITFLSTSLGAVTLGAHQVRFPLVMHLPRTVLGVKSLVRVKCFKLVMLQVMIGIYSTCTVSGEPLCQTAQSFMPGLIQGVNPNMEKVTYVGLIALYPLPVQILNVDLIQ